MKEPGIKALLNNRTRSFAHTNAEKHVKNQLSRTHKILRDMTASKSATNNIHLGQLQKISAGNWVNFPNFPTYQSRRPSVTQNVLEAFSIAFIGGRGLL